MIMNSSPYFVKKTVIILPFQINRQFENSEQQGGFIVWKIFLHSNFFPVLICGRFCYGVEQH